MRAINASFASTTKQLYIQHLSSSRRIIVMRSFAPSSLIEVAIEPATQADREKLLAALAELTSKDSSFRWRIDRESGQMILEGVSESLLDAGLDLLKRYNVNARIGAPQVAFLERPTVRAECEYTHKRQSGGAGQFASVRIAVEPTDSNAGFRFESAVPAGAVPRQYMCLAS
jgi:elongation factor G